MKTLTKKDRNYITSERYEKRKSRQKDLRIRKKIKQEIEDICFCIEKLSTDQHEQVFTSETLLPIFKSLHEYCSETRNIDKKGIVSNERAFHISIAIAQYCLNELGLQLVNEPHRTIMIGTSRLLLPQEINALATIHYTLERQKGKRQ